MKIEINLTAEATRTEIAAIETALAESFPGAEIEIETIGLHRTVKADDDATAYEAEQIIDTVFESL